jgi:hypothetical protein
MWAVLLGVLLVLAAATSSHAAVTGSHASVRSSHVQAVALRAGATSLSKSH